jgi:hypothetical protein
MEPDGEWQQGTGHKRRRRDQLSSPSFLVVISTVPILVELHTSAPFNVFSYLLLPSTHHSRCTSTLSYFFPNKLLSCILLPLCHVLSRSLVSRYGLCDKGECTTHHFIVFLVPFDLHRPPINLHAPVGLRLTLLLRLPSSLHTSTPPTAAVAPPSPTAGPPTLIPLTFYSW